MESWIKSVWVKRLLPFVLIAAIWGGYSWWSKWSEARLLAEEHQYALATARVWVATADFRYDQKRYLAYRDSLLASEGLSDEKMQAFRSRYDHDPEGALRFSSIIKHMVDSLINIERAQQKLPRESTVKK